MSLRVSSKCHCHWHCHFQCCWGRSDYLWPNMPISGHFGGVLGPQSDIFGGKKFPNWPSQMWSTMFNLVQPMFNPVGVARTAYGQLWQYLTEKGHFGGFWGPPVPFLGAKKGPNWPPQMWSIMFNLVQPMFNPFGVARTAYGQLWPYLTEKGHFWGVLGPPSAIFGGQKGSKLNPPDVKYNVQPCSTNVQPIWGCWECLWPNMAILGQKGHKIWPVAAPQGSKRVPQRSIILIWPTDI